MSLPWALEELLPHDHPMILIDEVYEDPDLGFYALTRISEDSPFFEPGQGVPSYIGMEYVAQTIGALVGLRALRDGGAVRLGYLLGTRAYHTDTPYFPLGSRLVIRVFPQFESDHLAQFTGVIETSAGREIARTSLNVYSGKIEGAAE